MEGSGTAADPSSSPIEPARTPQRAQRKRDPSRDEDDSADRRGVQHRLRRSERVRVEGAAEEEAAEEEGAAWQGARGASVSAPTVLEQSEEDEAQRVDRLIEDARL